MNARSKLCESLPVVNNTIKSSLYPLRICCTIYRLLSKISRRPSTPIGLRIDSDSEPHSPSKSLEVIRTLYTSRAKCIGGKFAYEIQYTGEAAVQVDSGALRLLSFFRVKVVYPLQPLRSLFIKVFLVLRCRVTNIPESTFLGYCIA